MPFSLLQVVLAAFTVPVELSTAPAEPVLQPSTIEDWRAAGMDGTVCYWSKRKNGPVLFVAAGETGLTRMDGAVVMLSPAQDAADLYPFTHDRWQNGQLTIRVIDSAVAEEIGYEAVTTAADLIVVKDGIVSRSTGFMICGS